MPVYYPAASGGSGAPTDAQYVTGAAVAGLSAELIYPAMVGNPDLLPSSPNADDEEFDSALSGSWAWLNQGTAAQTISGSNLIIADSPVASTVRLLYKTYTAGNFIFTTKYTINGLWGDYVEGGLALSDGTKITYFGPSLNGGTVLSLMVVNWATTSSFDSTALYNTSMAWPMTMYLQIEDNGTNLYFRWSTTGLPGTFIQVYTRGRTTFQTATKIGYGWRVTNTRPFAATADFLRRT